MIRARSRPRSLRGPTLLEGLGDPSPPQAASSSQPAPSSSTSSTTSSSDADSDAPDLGVPEPGDAPGEVAAEPGDVDEILPNAKRGRRSLPEPFPEVVDGHTLKYDERCVDGRTVYRRLYIACPLCDTAHRAARMCQKYRGLDLQRRSDRVDHVMEPVAYLVCWANGAARHSSQASHVRWTPSRQDVEQCLRDHGWLQ